jgi:hypothetical protein
MRWVASVDRLLKKINPAARAGLSPCLPGRPIERISWQQKKEGQSQIVGQLTGG